MSNGWQDAAVSAFALVINVMVGVCLLAVGWRALRPVTWKELLRFGIEHDLRFDATTAPTVMRTLALRRSCRLVGALVGGVTPMVASALGARLDPGSPWWMAWIGYFAGALLGAWWPHPVGDRPKRVALLVPRRVTDYVSRRALIVAAAMLVAGTASAVVAAVGPRRDDAWGPGRAGIVVSMVLALVVAAVCITTMRRVVDRAQPGDSPAMVAADDALRASALAVTNGAGLSMIAVLCGSAAFNTASFSDVQLARWVLPWVGVAMMLVAYGTWFGLRPSLRRVRRVAV